MKRALEMGRSIALTAKRRRHFGPQASFRVIVCVTLRLSRPSPPRIDLNVLKRAVYGVSQLDGDELTVCLGVTQPSPTYDKQAKGDEGTRPTAISPEAGTVIVLRRVKE